jgi:hypothetical protein
MRLNTILSLLAERRMGGRDLDAALKNAPEGSLIGFEVEVWVPESSDLYREGEARPRDTTSLVGEDLKFFYDSDYFHQNGGWRSSVEAAVEMWNEEKRQEHVEENWQRYLDFDPDDPDADEDAANEEARDKAADDYRDQDRDAWFEDRYGDRTGPEEFAYEFDLVPTHGWETEPNRRGTAGASIYTESEDDEATADQKKEATHEEVRDELGYVTGFGWRVVPDGSVTDDGTGEDGVDAELVSPPMPAGEAFGELEQVFQFIEDHGLETNSTTGLHVNISVPGLVEKLDPLKLVLLMGEGHALAEFDREASTYAQTHRTDLLQAVQKTGELPRDADSLLDWARRQLQTAKYRTVNLGKLQHGYLEFRVAGGEGYHRRLAEVRAQTGRWLAALAAAMDPDADRREYLKKLAKLVSAGERAPYEPVSLDDLWRHAAGAMEHELPLLRAAAKGKLEGGDSKENAAMIASLRDALQSLGGKPRVLRAAPDRARIELRQLLTRAAANYPEAFKRLWDPAGRPLAAVGQGKLDALWRELGLTPPGK